MQPDVGNEPYLSKEKYHTHFADMNFSQSTFWDMEFYPVTDRQTESDTYASTVQDAQLGSKICSLLDITRNIFDAHSYVGQEMPRERQKWFLIFFQPTFATCMVGSYASLSVYRLSRVCTLDLTKKGENNSYLRKYCSKLLVYL